MGRRRFFRWRFCDFRRGMDMGGGMCLRIWGLDLSIDMLILRGLCEWRGD